MGSIRVFFIAGLGEKDHVFDKIASGLCGEHHFINLWDALGHGKRAELKIVAFSKELISKYNILSSDIIIGHSLGGKLAHHIKHINGNIVVQIASWTDQNKPIVPIKNKKILYWLVRKGITLSPMAKKFMMKSYHHDDTKVYYEEAYDNLMQGNRNCVVNQFRLLLESAEEPVDVKPDLRIHALNDNIVSFPDEEYVQVSGDHFSLLTHPEEVIEPIRMFIDNLALEEK